MTLVNETAVQTYFCPVQQVCLALQLRLVWFYWDPLGTFAPLAGLHRLISCPTTISLYNHYYRSQVLSARQLSFAIFLRSLAWIGKFPLFIRFAPLDPCPALGNFLNGSLSSLEGVRVQSQLLNTHSNPQPLTVMLRQPVLGSFQPVTQALVTTGTRITPLTMLPSLHQQCFPSTSTTRICTYRRNNSLPTIAQHFHTRLFRHPAHVCTKCHPALS